MTSKEALSQQLKAFESVAYKLKYDTEKLDVETVDHLYKWTTDIINVIEHAIQKEDEFEIIKLKMIEKEGDLVFPFVERTK